MVSISTRASGFCPCGKRAEYTVEQGRKVVSLCVSHTSDVKNGYETIESIQEDSA